jgi:hypothetical protein
MTNENTMHNSENDPSSPLPRVFVIGFNRCGTRTIHSYFKSNGYKSVHWDKGNLANAIFRNLMEAMPLLTGYEGFSVFSDMEHIVPKVFAFEAYKLYPYFDVQYPGSVFILNTRDVDKWIKSRLDHGSGGYAAKWRTLFNVSNNEMLIARWRQEWERHHDKVERYFSGSRSRFLKFNIESDVPEKINTALPEYRLDAEKFSTRGRSAKSSAAEDTDTPA